jgi:hypothetical protein
MTNELEMLLGRVLGSLADYIVERVRPIVAEEVRKALADAEGDRFLDAHDLAGLLGISPEALRKRLARGSELAAVAVTLDGRRVWRRGEVTAMLSRPRRGAPTLRSIREGGQR